MDNNSKPPMVELRMRWLVPAVLLFSLWLNYSIVSAGTLQVDQFAPVVVRSGRLANYGQDPLNLTFPAVDPQLFEQVLQDQALGSAGQSLTGGGAGAPQPGQATATPQPGLNDGGVLPTTVSSIPTVVGAVPTVVGAVEDLTNQILPGAGDIVSGVTDPIIEVLSTLPVQVPIPTLCIPVPFVKSCP